MTDKKRFFSVLTFTSNATVYRFKQPLQLQHEKLDNRLLCLSRDEEPILQAFGKSWKECIDGIREELEMLWEEYAMADDSTLTQGAIMLKNILRDMVVKEV